MQADAGAPKRVLRGGYGLFGGVFDPVHLGHRAVAEAALQHLPIDEVRFLPAGDPPHKSDRPISAAKTRLELLEIATRDDRRFQIDARETARPGPSYTVLTLEELTAERPGETIYFLIGADNARHIGSWYAAERLFELCTPVIVTRPGDEAEFRPSEVPFLSEERRRELNEAIIEGPSFPQSSQEIRRRAAAGKSLDGWVHPEVAARIAALSLYSATSE